MSDAVDRHFTQQSFRPTRRPALASPEIVDHQFHWYPRRYLDVLARRRDYPRVDADQAGELTLHLDDDLKQTAVGPLSADIDEQMSQAAAAGVSQVILGPATLAEILAIDAGEAEQLLDVLHQEYAEAQRRHPGRIAALAALPLQDPSVALRVLEHAVGGLGLRGVTILTVNEGRPLADERLMPVYHRIAELDVPIVLHPGGRAPLRQHTQGYRQQGGLGWPYQTAAAVLEMIDSGLFDEVPDLHVVHPHLGGVLPYVAGRVSPIPGGHAKHPLEYYLRTNFYADTASQTSAALSTAIATYGIDRILFASDHPFVGLSEMRAFVEDNLTGADASHVYANRVPNLRTMS